MICYLAFYLSPNREAEMTKRPDEHVETTVHLRHLRQKLTKAVSRAIPVALASGLLVGSSCFGPFNGGDSSRACFDRAPNCEAPFFIKGNKLDDGGSGERMQIHFSFVPKDKLRPMDECLALCKELVKEKCGSLNFIDCKIEGDNQSTGGVDATCSTAQRVCRVAGRRPDGLAQPEPLIHVSAKSKWHTVGGFFAQLAYLEEAAVTAFSHLAMELEAHNAPEALCAIAREGIREEIEHTQMMKALAARYGVTDLPKVQVAPFKLRPLSEIAYDNAREGCVRETFGSVLAFWQSQMAEDEAVRCVMQRVAEEESQHAALSWAIDEWAQPLLSREEQSQCAKLKETSLAALRNELAEPVAPELITYAGFPPPAVSVAMLNGILA